MLLGRAGLDGGRPARRRWRAAAPLTTTPLRVRRPKRRARGRQDVAHREFVRALRLDGAKESTKAGAGRGGRVGGARGPAVASLAERQRPTTARSGPALLR